ncbi:helix-turn-helix transcriptional regulator [Ancylobacter pratisalsi]|uniref:Helix-turn-helix domain-containing protein n=1 Tax=Ancylobacter pratisalsi TaxID=1745854 RepID=A0A6P1YI77_9HYPH|nr:helix-turn-helix domain-containing protein [Ancylobacter pratisalsi]QIB32670.1 helix-turn-helix domain-containing protein [Ancylobacter pratisalsi]
MSGNNPPIIRGAKAIAHELGCSPRTVSRLAANGKLPVKKAFSGGRTSPLVINRKELDDLKHDRKG